MAKTNPEKGPQYQYIADFAHIAEATMNRGQDPTLTHLLGMLYEHCSLSKGEAALPEGTNLTKPVKLPKLKKQQVVPRTRLIRYA